jgi:hypothetical protein
LNILGCYLLFNAEIGNCPVVVVPLLWNFDFDLLGLQLVEPSSDYFGYDNTDESFEPDSFVLIVSGNLRWFVVEI